MPEPQKIGKYTIIERIGRGGMGYVYRAHDPILKRDVALKTMLKDVSDDEDLRNRFTREAQSAGGLRHPNIVTIYDLGEDDQGCPFIAMEFLTGTDLEHLIKNRIELQMQKKLEIMIRTCEGLGYAHNNGIVHRDIKTANIRLLDNGEVKIMDFGIAKMTSSHFTRTGMIMGTPHYMAPEQIRGEKVDGRADIFSLGVMLYELLTFRKPFPGDNPTTVLFKIIHEEPDPLIDGTFSGPPELQEVINRSLAKKPEQRYQTCEEFAEDLRHIYYSLQGDTSTQDTASQSGDQPSSTRRITGTPVPTIRRTGPLDPSVRPGTGRNMTLPSQQRTADSGRIDPPQTQVSSPTHATVARGAEATRMNDGETLFASSGAAAPEVRDLPSITPTPVPSSKKLWITSGVFGVVIIVALAIGVMKFTGKDEPNPAVITDPVKPPIDKDIPPKPPVVAEKDIGWLALDVQPWAEITEMKDARGTFITPPFASTPCRMQLEPGTYVITLENSQFKPLKIQVDIKKSQTTMIKRRMEGFNYAEAVKSFGF